MVLCSNPTLVLARSFALHSLPSVRLLSFVFPSALLLDGSCPAAFMHCCQVLFLVS